MDLSAFTTQLSQRLGVPLGVRLGVGETAETLPGAELPTIGLKQPPDEVGGPAAGDRLGDLVVLGPLGSGGMGQVLLVRDDDLGRELAAKVVRSEAADPWLLAKFLVEARVTGQLEHPGIVPVHALGVTPDGRLYMAMKRVAGRTLTRLLHTSDPPLERLIEILLKVCDAIHFAHSRGVIHRDIKPDNVMVGEFGEVQVMDWGVAKVLPNDDGVSIDLARTAEEAGLPDADALATRTGTVVGTLMYMAPEQALGEAVDARADVYAIGAMLYAMLTLVHPFGGGSGAAVLAQVVAGRFDPPSTRTPDRDIPRALEAVVLRSMQRDPDARYPDVAALREELTAFLGGRPVTAASYSRWQRVRMWINREPLRVAALLVCALVLTMLGVGLEGATTRRRERQRAAAEARAALLEAAGELDRADAEVINALRADPTSWEAHVHMGLILRRRGKAGESRATLLRARELAPESARALIERLLR